MKRLTVIIVMGLLFSGLVFAAADGEEIKKYMKQGRAELVKYYSSKDVEHFDKAVANYKNVLEKDPENDGAMIMIANLYIRRTNQIVGQLDTREFDNKRTHFAVGNLLLARKNYKQALRHYDICAEKYPKWACPLRHKGEALLKAGRSGDAVRVLKKCVDVRAGHFDAYV